MVNEYHNPEEDTVKLSLDSSHYEDESLIHLENAGQTDPFSVQRIPEYTPKSRQNQAEFARHLRIDRLYERAFEF